jgi:cytochrome c-type biogenesis protein CcmH
MIKRLISILTLCLLLGTGTAQAGVTLEAFKFNTEAEEQHFKDLIEELRCLVCQNQSLLDSDAELAHDLRATRRLSSFWLPVTETSYFTNHR